MGTVYDALHRMTNRRVAIKVLLPEHATKADSIARFQQEARVVASIGHSHICEILDFGSLEDGRPFLVMERLEGQTLGALLEERGRLRYEDVVPLVQQVLFALSAAHAKGVIHRDMKPDNIFITRKPGAKPVAKVLDFGISKAMAEDREVELTRTGMVMGTPYYMAPEQARGDRRLDPRVDVWAVGVILYESISGRRPFVAKNYNALLVEILTSQHPPLDAPNTPKELEAVVDRALRKRRAERYGSVEELAAALEPFARPAEPARPKLGKYVDIGGVQIPVTWEDTGGETPASGGVKMLDVAALRSAIEAEAAVTGGLGRPPGHVAAATRSSTRSPAPSAPPPAVRGTETASYPPAPPQVAYKTSAPSPAVARAVEATARSAQSDHRRSPMPSSLSEPSMRRSGGPDAVRRHDPRAGAGTSKPPQIDDEETTMVLLESLDSADAATEEPTPLRRRAGSTVTPPPPPPEERVEEVVEDTETTIVDSEPPSFATDAYRSVRDPWGRRDS